MTALSTSRSRNFAATRPGALAALVKAGLALALLPSGSCYRPIQTDCVLKCAGDGACPSRMRCSSGLCTRGSSCVTDVAAGGMHSCAIHADRIKCWGDGSYGQLGRGVSDNQGDDETTFTAIDLPGHPAAIAAGGRHSCAILDRGSGGEAACWGANPFGQLGSAQPDGAAAGGTVPLGTGRTVASIAAGLHHTCALLDGGEVKCWGDNRFGQLGVAGPSRGGAGDPMGESLLGPPLGGAAIALAAGAYHTCAIVQNRAPTAPARGVVKCWGSNDYGQLNGDRLEGNSVPGLIATADLGDRAATSIAAGAYHTCAVLDQGEVMCWGQSGAGQAGVAPKSQSVRYTGVPPSLVALGAGRKALSAAAGASHTCALLDDFSVACWGFNGDGELGTGDTVNSGDEAQPLRPPRRVGLGGGLVSRISVGANHTCVVQAAGVKCWGSNDSGRLGVGDVQARGDDLESYPIAAMNLDDVK